MKRLLFALMLVAVTLGAQQQPPVAYQPQLISYPSTPFGSCQIYQAALNTSNGLYYLCNPATNTWVSASSIASNIPLPAATSGPGPVFNVKNYGAKGDTQMSSGNCTLNNGSANLSCTGVTFTSADINKRANCGLQIGTGLFFTAGSTISSIVNSTTAALSSTANGNTSVASCAWGTPDDTPVGNAVTAWLAAIRAGPGQASTFLGTNPAAPVIYFPPGGYLLCGSTNNSVMNLPASAGGAAIIADAPRSAWLVACDNAANAGAVGFFINQGSGAGGLVIKNLSFTNSYFANNGSFALVLSGSHYTENLYITHWNANTPAEFLGSGYNLNFVQDNSSGPILCSSCSDEFHFGGSSNNGNSTNLQITNAVGLNANTGPRFVNVLVDECGSNATGCTKVQNSSDVWFIGSSLFSTTGGQALNVDGNSFVHIDGGIVGVFGADTNASGLKVQPGGIVQSQDVRYVASGTGNPINNSGIFNDNGGNTNESQFAIVSGTSTGTTAVLTLTNAGAAINTNCAVGDALMVQGAGIAGYNGYYPAGATSGITATSATTVTYTTAGSNLGALGAGGTAYCRNLITYSGTLPRALLNNPIPNTCYVTITPITNATTFNMCQWGAGTPTNITRITATSQVVTTCATAPIVTISNGTVSETLTLTSGKQFWDSFNAQDVSTGVGTTIFKPSISATGTDRLTMKYDTGALSSCATPPTNLSVSYTIAPILSN